MNKILITVLILITASGCTTTLDQKQDIANSTVTEVVDGDTVDIRLGTTTETVRLLGVDTPEVHVENSPEEYQDIPNNTRGRECLEKWGEKASEYAKKTLQGKKVQFKTDPKSDTRGSYGRLLGYIYINGTNFNHQLVEKGYARVYESGFSQQERFLEAQQNAKKNIKGLWTCRTYEINDITVE